MVPPDSDEADVRSLIEAGERALTAQDFDRAEVLFKKVLTIEVSNQRARNGIAEVTSRRKDGEEQTPSWNWHMQYAAGADESIDQPPPLAHDIFESLEPPNSVGPAAGQRTDSHVKREAAEGRLPTLSSHQDPVDGNDAVGGEPEGDAPGTGGSDPLAALGAHRIGRGQNPTVDPMLWPQSQLATVPTDYDRNTIQNIVRHSESPEKDENIVLPDPDRGLPTGLTSNDDPLADVTWDESPPQNEMDDDALVAEVLNDMTDPQIASRKSRPTFEPKPIYSFSQERSVETTIDTFEDEVDDDDETMNALLQLADRRHHAGDYSGSMDLVRKVLKQQPEHPVALSLFELNQTELLEKYRARIGDVVRSPRLRLRQQEYVWQSLTHQEGFVLSQVDGKTPYSDIIEISSMPEFEVTRILAKLVELRIIG